MDIAPLFPFGHGLSYTTFKLSDIRLGKTLQLRVKNTGPCAGAEVVQVYVAPVLPPVERPEKELKGFSKVFLETQAEMVLDIEADPLRWTSFWDERTGKWCSHAGLSHARLIRVQKGLAWQLFVYFEVNTNLPLQPLYNH